MTVTVTMIKMMNMNNRSDYSIDLLINAKFDLDDNVSSFLSFNYIEERRNKFAIDELPLLTYIRNLGKQMAIMLSNCNNFQ